MIKRLIAAIATPAILSMPMLKASADKTGDYFVTSSEQAVKNQEKIIFLLQAVMDQLNIVQKNIGVSDLKTEMALDTIWMVLEQVQDYQLARPNGRELELEAMFNKGLISEHDYNLELQLMKPTNGD